MFFFDCGFLNGITLHFPMITSRLKIDIEAHGFRLSTSTFTIDIVQLIKMASPSFG
jgi:hypothetical protein